VGRKKRQAWYPRLADEVSDKMIDNDEDLWRKLLGVWQLSGTPGLIFQIKNEDVEVLIKGFGSNRLVKAIPYPLFLALEPVEILEIIEKELTWMKK
jgi:hypothetical protein|tara:strand:- start:231 stop:518 length:288 start_codon:yes stop_codon:yes gene_type:complete